MLTSDTAAPDTGQKVHENAKDSAGLQADVDSKASETVPVDDGKAKDVKTQPGASSGGQQDTGRPENSGTPDNSDTEKKAADSKDNSDSEWPTYTDPSMTAITNIFQEKGVKPSEADAIFAKALESGDIADINVDDLKAKVGEQYATLIMGTVQTVYNANLAQVEATRKMAYDALGGRAGWEACAEWAETKAASDADFNKKLDTYKSMIESGGEQAVLAIRTIKEQFMDDPNTVNRPNLERGDAAGSAMPDIKPITNKVDYVTQLKEAYNKGDEAQIAKLRRARAAGRKIEQSRQPGTGW